MPVAFFHVLLSVQPRAEGEAELMLPQVVHGLDYHFILVKDGGAEGIIQLEGPAAVLQQVEKEKDCKKLTAKQLETLQASYPKPKIKQKYRMQSQTSETGESMPAAGLFEVDHAGNKIVETFQTVRAGFYLIDVPVAAQSTGTEHPGRRAIAPAPPTGSR